MMVPQPPLVAAEKINICLTCGSKGDSRRLVYCIQCKSCAQHSYCLEKIHRDDNRTVIWKCGECAPSNPKRKTEPLRKSERISYATDAKYKRMIMKKKSGVVGKQPLVKSNEVESVGCLAKKDTEKILPILENENVFCKQPESPKDPSNMSSDKQARECEICAESEVVTPLLLQYSEFDKNSCAQPLSDSVLTSNEGESVGCLAKNDTENILPILENENVFLKQPESPKDPSNMSSDMQAMECEIYTESEVIMPPLLQYPEFDKNSRAQPLSDPVWTGQFRMHNATHFNLTAYISSKASPKVNSAVTVLPELLDVEMLSKRIIWPKSFAACPPNSDCIGLYFFPQYERDEMIFDRVLDIVIEKDNALKAVINNNLELLIFSSHLLPPDERRICTKYYLWGIFKSKPRK